LKDIAKMSVSVSQLVSQALITYLPSMPDLIRTALIYGSLPGVQLCCQLHGGESLGCWGRECPPEPLLRRRGGGPRAPPGADRRAIPRDQMPSPCWLPLLSTEPPTR
jgi:hypothetical protein